MNAKVVWQRYVDWFTARQPRERLILAIAAVGGIAFLGYSFAIEPPMLAARQADRLMMTLPAETLVFQTQARVLGAQAQDPDGALRAELARIAADFSEQSQRFRIVERSLIPPGQMADLLESLLKRSRGLEVISLRTIAPVSVLDAAAGKSTDGAAETPAPGTAATALAAASGHLYKHGIELRVAGNYLELLAYLQQLESEAPNILWGRLEIKTERYPRSVMTLTVYSLSMDKSWLEL